MVAQSGGDEFVMQIPNNKVWGGNMSSCRHVFWQCFVYSHLG